MIFIEKRIKYDRRLPYELLGELIGEEVEISRSRDKKLIGLSGKIVYETKDAFLIKTASRYRRVYKRGTEFIFRGLKLRVLGDVLYIDPAYRTRYMRLKKR